VEQVTIRRCLFTCNFLFFFLKNREGRYMHAYKFSREDNSERWSHLTVYLYLHTPVIFHCSACEPVLRSKENFRKRAREGAKVTPCATCRCNIHNSHWKKKRGLHVGFARENKPVFLQQFVTCSLVFVCLPEVFLSMAWAQVF